MTERLKKQIVEHLTHDTYRPAPVEGLIADMRIEREEQGAFRATVDELVSAGRIEIGDDERVRLPKVGETVTGKFKLNQRGFGFILPEQASREGDIFVPAGSTGGAISGDRVRARVFMEQRGGGRRGGRGGGRDEGKPRMVGRITDVLERGQETFVGVLIKRGREWLVEPDGRSLHEPVVIRDPHPKFPNGAVEGVKVAFDITQYPEDGQRAEGVITQVLGEAGRPDVETQSVIVAHGLRTEMPADAVRQASDAARQFEKEAHGPLKNREDLTKTFTFTIDPPDAKDFDDAISLERDAARNEWTLGVHIADVTHFVEQGSPLDKEAKARGTSVYLPRLVIPMLPESLSNGVCSLQEGVNRFTMSAFMTFDGEGTVLRQRVAATVIKSSKRLTYLEAQALIDGDEVEARKNARTETAFTDELKATLKQCDQLAKILRKRRQRDGMISLELPQVELKFDEEGRVVDAVPEDNAYTHTVIEMFMVEANEAVARLFNSIDVPVLRRIHPEPAHGDITELRQFAASVKYKLPEHPERRDLQKFLDFTRGTPAARAVHLAVLRTLSKATYDPALVGHFALASEHYAHFTSPIRRYPDLSLHLELQAYLDLTDNGKSVGSGRQRKELTKRMMDDPRVPDEEALTVLGRHCSEREVAAADAERELRQFLVLQYLADHHMGDEMKAIVTGFTPSGIFISIDKYLIDGRVAMEDIGIAREREDTKPNVNEKKKGKGQWPNEARGGRRGTRWVMQTGGTRVVAEGSGQWIALGEQVTVRILRIDLGSRHMDLGITELPVRSAKPREEDAAVSVNGAGEGRGEGRGRGRKKPLNEKQLKQQERLLQKRERKQKNRRRKGGYR